MAESEIKRVYEEYSSENQVSDQMILATLDHQARQVLVGAILDGVLAAMLILSVVINCATLGKPLKIKEHTKTKNHDKRVYGRLAEEKASLD